MVRCLGSTAALQNGRTRIDSSDFYTAASRPFQSTSRRSFETERDYHPVADEALEVIQDAVDDLLESAEEEIEYDISLESGVLTLKFPPHGIWVINKQTPNRQIWVRTFRVGRDQVD
jgi:frataxin